MHNKIITAATRKENKHLLEQYFNLRASDYKSGLYAGGSDKYDAKKSTIFILCLNKDETEVIGGARFIFKDDITRLKAEESYGFKIKDFIGHIPKLRQMKIAEISGVVVSEDHRGKHIGSHVQHAALKYMLDSQVNVDIVVAMLTRANTNCYIRVLKALQPELQSAVIHKHDFFRADERRVLTISANISKDIQLFTPSMERSGDILPVRWNTEVVKPREQVADRPFMGITSTERSIILSNRYDLNRQDKHRHRTA